MQMYHVQDPEGIILRDYLARDRTELALKRTLLAYIRTALGMFSTGMACVKLIDDAKAIATIGWVLVAVSPAFLIAGAINYLTTRRKLRSIPDNHLLK